MSKTVMSHLEMIRSRAELEMGVNMLTGLGDLVRNSSAGLTGPGRERTRKPTSDPFAAINVAKAASPVALHASLKKEGPDAAEARHASDTSVNSGKATTDAPTPPAGADFRHVRRGANPEAGEDVQEAFQEAATLLRAAMGIDGALFLDASINTYGGAIQSNSHGGSRESSSISGTTNVNRGSDSYQESDDALCKILGISESSEDGPAQCPNISEKFLKTLLEQYPRGKVWSFEDSVPSEYVLDAPETADVSRLDSSHFRADRTRSRSAEAKKLQRLFPGVRGLCLIGIWDCEYNCTSYFYVRTNISALRVSHSRAMVWRHPSLDILAFSSTLEQYRIGLFDCFQ
jgi:hypothetical protein